VIAIGEDKPFPECSREELRSLLREGSKPERPIRKAARYRRGRCDEAARAQRKAEKARIRQFCEPRDLKSGNRKPTNGAPL
jgi:uncharacterized membrane protein